ncbi:tyrosine-protein phosphatase [Anaerorhabdus sp.]|uniref:tyrosine-protein phosphatase n=1 Tax=Anaerorhabdus sp. TaxID=1872524 RepID=UPI002FC8DFF3
MIDTHCHVVFGVDDGAQCMEDALQMIEVAIQHGMTAILCTPHSIPGHRYQRNTLSYLSKNFEILKAKVKECNYPIELYLGSEFQATDDSIEWIKEHKVVTLNNTNRVLVELPWYYGGKTSHSEEYYLQLLLDEGYRVIVAHPERYESVQKDFSTLQRWREMGCYFQVNRTSLVKNGEAAYVQDVAWRMVREGYCDVIASDAHGYIGMRVNRLDDIYEILEQEISPEFAKRVCITNPNCSITGEDYIV